MQDNTEELVELFKQAVILCYQKDRDIIRDGGMEQASVARFMIYFQESLNNDARYRPYDLDCEYNKKRGDTKKIPDSFPEGIRPDIIVHERGTDDNLLVAEFKTYKNKNNKRRRGRYANRTEIDIARLKLHELTADDKGYAYKVGVLVILGRDSADYEFYRHGSREVA